MSSHHFVKEQQEPALLLVDAISKNVVDPLLEWSPTVLVIRHALDQVLLWGVKVDVVVANGVHEPALTEKLSSYGPMKILYSGEGSTLETALYFLISSKQPSVNIVVSEPAPMIETLKPFTGRLNISLITSAARWSFIRTGNFKKWLPAESRLEVLGAQSLCHSNLSVAGKGFKVQQDGIAELASASGFWVGEVL